MSPSKNPGKQLQVLVVEDVPEMASMLEQLLNGIPGVRVSGTVGNGFEARIEVTRRRPDVVLLDEILPGESSLDLLAELNAQQIPVWLVTGMENASHPIPPQALGRLVKPSWDTFDEAQGRFEKALRSVRS